MKKGFTLTEMIAVIGIIGLMSFMILPRLLNQVSNKKEELSKATEQILFDAAELYANNNVTAYPKTSGVSYCIKLLTLSDLEYIKKPLTDIKTGKEIDLNKGVMITVDEYNQYGKFEIVESC